MISKHKKILGLLGGVFIFFALFNLAPKSANAATLAVDSDCTLNEAIAAVNAAVDGSGCVKTGAAYGTGDTINIPSGTTTLSADLPALTEPVVINGAGKSATVIQAAGNTVFRYTPSAGPETRTLDFTIKNLKINGADTYAIDFDGPKHAVLDELEVTDSGQAVRVRSAEEVDVSNTYIHHNTSTGTDNTVIAGLNVTLSTSDHDGIVSATITDTQITNNTGYQAGGIVTSDETVNGTDNDAGVYIKPTIQFRGVTVSDNHGDVVSGLGIIGSGGPLARNNIELSVDATTVANNETEVADPTAFAENELGAQLPILSGFLVTGKLTSNHHFTNVTVAFNSTISPAPDNRRALSGFFASLADSGSNMDIVNTTVVGNSTTQDVELATMPAFFATKVALNMSFQVTSLTSGSSATNVLVANNTFNGAKKNCLSSLDGLFFGFDEDVDVTPVNLGHNMSDDQSCTGYQYVPNLYDTIDHEVKNNGGPVPTVALHTDSPAINGGGQVLGINTDARGVPRNGHYSVGAYQGSLLAASTTNSGGGTLANTGAIAISSAVLIGLIVITLGFIYRDYRRHRKPLAAVDPDVSYSFLHHVRVVTIPLFRYRMSIKVTKKNSAAANDPDGLHKF